MVSRKGGRTLKLKPWSPLWSLDSSGQQVWRMGDKLSSSVIDREGNLEYSWSGSLGQCKAREQRVRRRGGLIKGATRKLRYHSAQFARVHLDCLSIHIWNRWIKEPEEWIASPGICCNTQQNPTGTCKSNDVLNLIHNLKLRSVAIQPIVATWHVSSDGFLCLLSCTCNLKNHTTIGSSILRWRARQLIEKTSQYLVMMNRGLDSPFIFWSYLSVTPSVPRYTVTVWMLPIISPSAIQSRSRDRRCTELERSSEIYDDSPTGYQPGNMFLKADDPWRRTAYERGN